MAHFMVLWVFFFSFGALMVPETVVFAQTAVECPGDIYFFVNTTADLNRDIYVRLPADDLDDCIEQCYSSQFCFSAIYRPKLKNKECSFSYHSAYNCTRKSLTTSYTHTGKYTIIECLKCPDLGDLTTAATTEAATTSTASSTLTTETVSTTVEETTSTENATSTVANVTSTETSTLNATDTSTASTAAVNATTEAENATEAANTTSVSTSVAAENATEAENVTSTVAPTTSTENVTETENATAAVTGEAAIEATVTSVTKEESTTKVCSGSVSAYWETTDLEKTTNFSAHEEVSSAYECATVCYERSCVKAGYSPVSSDDDDEENGGACIMSFDEDDAENCTTAADEERNILSSATEVSSTITIFCATCDESESTGESVEGTTEAESTNVCGDGILSFAVVKPSPSKQLPDVEEQEAAGSAEECASICYQQNCTAAGYQPTAEGSNLATTGICLLSFKDSSSLSQCQDETTYQEYQTTQPILIVCITCASVKLSQPSKTQVKLPDTKIDVELDSSSSTGLVFNEVTCYTCVSNEPCNSGSCQGSYCVVQAQRSELFGVTVVSQACGVGRAVSIQDGCHLRTVEAQSSLTCVCASDFCNSGDKVADFLASGKETTTRKTVDEGKPTTATSSVEVTTRTLEEKTTHKPLITSTKIVPTSSVEILTSTLEEKTTRKPLVTSTKIVPTSSVELTTSTLEEKTTHKPLVTSTKIVPEAQEDSTQKTTTKTPARKCPEAVVFQISGKAWLSSEETLARVSKVVLVKAVSDCAKYCYETRCAEAMYIPEGRICLLSHEENSDSEPCDDSILSYVEGHETVQPVLLRCVRCGVHSVAAVVEAPSKVQIKDEQEVSLSTATDSEGAKTTTAILGKATSHSTLAAKVQTTTAKAGVQTTTTTSVKTATATSAKTATSTLPAKAQATSTGKAASKTTTTVNAESNTDSTDGTKDVKKTTQSAEEKHETTTETTSTTTKKSSIVAKTLDKSIAQVPAHYLPQEMNYDGLNKQENALVVPTRKPTTTTEPPKSSSVDEPLPPKVKDESVVDVQSVSVTTDAPAPKNSFVGEVLPPKVKDESVIHVPSVSVTDVGSCIVTFEVAQVDTSINLAFRNGTRTATSAAHCATRCYSAGCTLAGWDPNNKYCFFYFGKRNFCANNKRYHVYKATYPVWLPCLRCETNVSKSDDGQPAIATTTSKPKTTEKVSQLQSESSTAAPKALVVEEEPKTVLADKKSHVVVIVDEKAKAVAVPEETTTAKTQSLRTSSQSLSTESESTSANTVASPESGSTTLVKATTDVTVTERSEKISTDAVVNSESKSSPLVKSTDTTVTERTSQTEDVVKTTTAPKPSTEILKIAEAKVKHTSSTKTQSCKGVVSFELSLIPFVDDFQYDEQLGTNSAQVCAKWCFERGCNIAGFIPPRNLCLVSYRPRSCYGPAIRFVSHNTSEVVRIDCINCDSDIISVETSRQKEVEFSERIDHPPNTIKIDRVKPRHGEKDVGLLKHIRTGSECPGRLVFQAHVVDSLPRLNVTNDIFAKSPSDCAEKCWEVNCTMAGYIPNPVSNGGVCLLSKDPGQCKSSQARVPQYGDSRPFVISCITCSACNYSLGLAVPMSVLPSLNIQTDAASVTECAVRCEELSCTAAAYSDRATAGNCLLSTEGQEVCGQRDELDLNSQESLPLKLNCVRCNYN